MNLSSIKSLIIISNLIGNTPDYFEENNLEVLLKNLAYEFSEVGYFYNPLKEEVLNIVLYDFSFREVSFVEFDISTSAEILYAKIVGYYDRRGNIDFDTTINYSKFPI